MIVGVCDLSCSSEFVGGCFRVKTAEKSSEKIFSVVMLLMLNSTMGL